LQGFINQRDRRLHFGTEQAANSPLTLNDLELLKQTVLFMDEDERYLRLAGEVLVKLMRY